MSEKAGKKIDMEKAMHLLNAVAVREGIEVAQKQVVLAVSETETEDYVAGLKAVQYTLAGVDRRIERMLREARAQAPEQDADSRMQEEADSRMQKPPAVPPLNLMEQVERRARELTDGHVTILKFTTHWKAAFGSPDFDGVESSREWLSAQPGFPTLHTALVDLMATERKWEYEGVRKQTTVAEIAGHGVAQMADGRTLAEVAEFNKVPPPPMQPKREAF